jgi:hypothetical protein
VNEEYISILLDIKSEVGSLNGRMMEATHSRQRMEKHIEELKESVAEIKPVVKVVATMKPEHDGLMKLRDRLGAYVWVAGGFASVVLYLLWQGLMYFSESIKSALGRLFH